jgi:hypothetical protein
MVSKPPLKEPNCVPLIVAALGVDSWESLTGEDRLELSGTTKEVTERNNTDHILDDS